MALIDGKQIAQKILDAARWEAQRLNVKARLAVLMVGNNEASAKYVARKAQAAEYVGVEFYLQKYPETITTEQLIDELLRTQMRNDAVIVQLPLPKHIDTKKVLDAIHIKKDADCLSAAGLGSVLRGDSVIFPPTARAVMEILHSKKVNLKGKQVVVVGQGELVGKPVAAIFLNQPVTLTICGLGTKNLLGHTKEADILITGVGKANLIKANMVKNGVVIIDAGTSFVKGQLVGDVDVPGVVKKSKWVTPTPGGVGPITVAILLQNTITLARQ